MIVTTTPSVEGKNITAYHALITGEAFLGAGVFRDLFAAASDMVGDRSAVAADRHNETTKVPVVSASGTAFSLS